MKYYVAADVHGYYTEFHRMLEAAGYFDERKEHRLVLLGDAFDRGPEALEMQDFILKLLARGELILVRGNHEDLFEELVTVDRGLPVRHHWSNGTYDTALQLTGWSEKQAAAGHMAFAAEARRTPYYRQIIPAAVDFFETENFIFVHGWIPCEREGSEGFSYRADWREADSEDWRRARWINGMDAAQGCPAGKTVLCGHWHCSYGHARYEHIGSEFGPDADFSPYYGPGVIALDACTAYSGEINILRIED